MKKYLLISCIAMSMAITAQSQVIIFNEPDTSQPVPQVYNPKASKLYQRVFTPLKPTTDSSELVLSALPANVAISTTYFDETGRALQTVTKQASPSKKDFVSFIAYDKYGRLTRQHLPYVQQNYNTNDGKYKDSVLLRDSLFYHALFPNDSVFFSTTKFDASPLQRVLKSSAVGDAWAGADIGKTIAQRANTVNDSVRLWLIDINNEDDLPSTSATYTAGSLIVEELTDENNQKKVVYKNERGEMVLIKVQDAASLGTGHAGWLCTYYVYDETGALRYVITPKAVEALLAVNWNLAGNSTIGTGLCYSYFYDDKGRMTMKLIPGKDKSYIAYDMLGRVVMTQDAKLRTTNQWTYTKYDGQSRPVKSGLITTTQNKDSVLAQAYRTADYPILSGTYTVATETYYDDYSWASGAGMSSSLVTTHINSANFITTYNAYPEYAQQISISIKTRGMVTGGKKNILGSSDYLYCLPLYDQYNRVVQVKETNISGGTDVLTSQYSFSGRVLRTHFAHDKQGANAQIHTLITKYLYDHTGRVDSIIKNIDSTGDKLILSNTYYELGQVTAKKLSPSYNNNAGIETENFEYNIRGWLIGMNRNFVKDVSSTNWFGYEVAYDNTANIVSGQNYAAAQYNGNIAGLTWKGRGDGQKRKYDFTYDYNNRLKTAEFNQYTGSSFNKTAGVDFSVSNLTYDANGNILTMQQKGLKINSSTVIDHLSYSYSSNSNKLLQVTDTANNYSSLLGDFKYDAAGKTSTDYTYDANGSAISDKNKKIDSIKYNYLNLPEVVWLTNGRTITYTYDAAGNKLKKEVRESAGWQSWNTKTTSYMAGFVYESNQNFTAGIGIEVYYTDSLLYTGHEEGRIRKKGSGYVYDYFIRDHIGNIRTTLTEESQSDQYPAATMETAIATTEETYYKPKKFIRAKNQ